jgi:competence protein ComEC
MPIIIITVFLLLGIVAGSYMHLPISTASIVITAAAAIFFTLLWRSNRALAPRPYSTYAACFLFFVTGIFVQSLHYAPNHKMHYSHFLNDDPVIKGVVTERLKPNDYYEKYYLDVLSIDKRPASGKILITVPIDSLSKLLHAGDVLYIADMPKPINRALNPYQFDYAAYMAKQNVFHQLRLKNNYIKAGRLKNSDYYIEAFRNSLIGSFAQQGYGADVQDIINALLLGQRQDMDKDTTANYTNAGVVHILAISGLHFTVLFFIFNLLLKPLERLGKSGRLLKLIGILSLLWGFALVSGLSASVVRSVVMFSFIGIGQYFNRNSNIYNSIAVSALVLLLIKPNFIFDVGFQLSYIAVLSIVWLQPLYKEVKVSKYRVVNYIADTVLISLIAQIGVLPLSLYYFNQFPLLFLVANIVVIPLSTLVLVLGLVVLAFNFINVFIAQMLGSMLEALIQAMNNFTAWIASFHSLVLKDIPFTLLLNIALYIVIIATGVWLYRKNYRQTIAVLTAILLFQGMYTATEWNYRNSEELVILNNRQATLIAFKDREKIKVVSNDSLAAESNVIKSYSKGTFSNTIDVVPLQNLLWFKGQKILVIDSTGVYSIALKPDVILLSQSPKLNMERLIHDLEPKQIVADATNYKTYINRWEATCKKHNIAFHATISKGYYSISK